MEHRKCTSCGMKLQYLKIRCSNCGTLIPGNESQDQKARKRRGKKFDFGFYLAITWLLLMIFGPLVFGEIMGNQDDKKRREYQTTFEGENYKIAYNDFWIANTRRGSSYLSSKKGLSPGIILLPQGWDWLEEDKILLHIDKLYDHVDPITGKQKYIITDFDRQAKKINDSLYAYVVQSLPRQESSSKEVFKDFYIFSPGEDKMLRISFWSKNKKTANSLKMDLMEVLKTIDMYD